MIFILRINHRIAAAVTKHKKSPQDGVSRQLEINDLLYMENYQNTLHFRPFNRFYVKMDSSLSSCQNSCMICGSMIFLTLKHS